MIDPSEVSVVVQGPVGRGRGPLNNTNTTAECLLSVRRALPGAEVILSTWKGEDTAGLDYDVLVANDDPGPCDYFVLPARNVNRQVVSTAGGLAKVTRPYAVKLRSDTLLENANFLGLFAEEGARDPRVRLFRSRVVASLIGSMNPRRAWVFFHLSDFFYFGRTDDLRRLLDIPLAQAPPGAKPGSAPMATEQFILVSAMARTGPRPVLTGRFWSEVRYWTLWERTLANNFVLAHPSDLGILLPRRLYPHAAGAYSPNEWGYLDSLFRGERRFRWLAFRHYYFGILVSLLQRLRLP